MPGVIANAHVSVSSCSYFRYALLHAVLPLTKESITITNSESLALESPSNVSSLTL